MSKIEYSEINNLDLLKDQFSRHNIRKVIIKSLSPNDNSKNQLYLGMGFDAAQVFPHSAISPDQSMSSRPEPKFKADLDFSWIDATGRIDPAPYAQLILYPKYPEVRFSGFLRGINFQLSDLMGTHARIEGRLLIWGISDNKIFGHVISPENPLSVQIKSEFLDKNKLLNEYNSLNLSQSSKDLLIAKLFDIHSKGWISAYRLDGSGNRIEYNKSNSGGYTLEAEFGITPNGYSEPDFIDWELKQYSVPSFSKLHKKVITLMTPEPTGGVYKESGIKDFIVRYGYEDRNGRPDRLNFGGIHKVGEVHHLTGLKLVLSGYDSNRNKIINAFGAIQLIDNSATVAAEWSFSSLLDHWNRKHRHAAYIPSMKRDENGVIQYHYGNIIQLGENTDFLFFLKAMSANAIYYDPGIKMENVSSESPKTKRRSQFRVITTNLDSLYQNFETINVIGH